MVAKNKKHDDDIDKDKNNICEDGRNWLIIDPNSCETIIIEIFDFWCSNEISKAIIFYPLAINKLDVNPLDT